MIRKITILTVIALMVMSVSVMAQDVTKFFPKESTFFVKVNLQKMLGMVPAQARQHMLAESMSTFGYDFTQNIDAFYMAVENTGAEDPDFIGIFTGNLNLDQVLGIVRQQGHTVSQESIAGLQCYTVEEAEDEEEGEYEDDDMEIDDEEEQVFIANFMPNHYVVGNRASIERFSAVRSGSTANLSANSQLMGLISRFNNSAVISLAGVLSDSMKSGMAGPMAGMQEMNTFIADVSDQDSAIGYNVVLGMSTAEAANNLKMSLTQMTAMFAGQGQEGNPLSGLVSNMNMETKGNDLVISGSIDKTVLEMLGTQFGAMAGGMDEEDEY